MTPSVGATPSFTQDGTGDDPGYAAIDFRRFATGALQEGVMAAGSFEVTQRAAGANLSVDIAAGTADAGTGIAAYVQGDAVSNQGLYAVAPHSSATINEAIGAAHATLPRVDMVVLQIEDDTHDSSGQNRVQVKVVAGTATAGADLDDRLGAATLPDSALLLADVLVPATDTTISNSQIRDRRKWARGAYCRIEQVSGGTLTTSTPTMALMDSVNLQPRIECSGVPMRATLQGFIAAQVADVEVIVDLFVDGVSTSERPDTSQAAGDTLEISWDIVPAAGSHLLGPAYRNDDADTAVVQVPRNSTTSLVFTVEEIVRQNTANNTTTTG